MSCSRKFTEQKQFVPEWYVHLLHGNSWKKTVCLTLLLSLMCHLHAVLFLNLISSPYKYMNCKKISQKLIEIVDHCLQLTLCSHVVLKCNGTIKIRLHNRWRRIGWHTGTWSDRFSSTWAWCLVTIIVNFHLLAKCHYFSIL